MSRWIRCWALAIGLGCWSPFLFAEHAAALDNLKAAYLFNIAKFVSWPNDPRVIELCIDPQASLRGRLLALNGRALSQIRSLRVRAVESIHESCHLYFGREPFVETQVIPTSLVQQPEEDSTTQVLTISDAPKALESGYAFQLFLESKRLRIALSKKEVDASNYRVSSKLLRLTRERP